jgi:hypothetical protein
MMSLLKKHSSSSDAQQRSAPPLPSATSQAPIDSALGWQINKPINLPQLQSEISALSSGKVANAALSGPNDQTQPISDSNTADLWISPQGVDPQAVAQAFQDHVADPSWGIPQFILDFNTLLAQLRMDPEMTLTAEQQSTLIRGVALNFTMFTNSPTS